MRSFRAALAAALFAVLVVAAPLGAQSITTHDRILKAHEEPENWLTHHKDFAATRYSTLDEINKDNVKDLKVAWTAALGGIEGGGIWPHGGLEGTPIVEDGLMYVTDGWGSVYKFETRNGGELLWKMDPGTDKDWSGAVSCCGVNNRGVALWQNQVLSHTLDGRLIATDKESGEVLWEKQLADPAIAEVITVAPLVVKDMVITGVSGAEYGIRGWIAATDLKTQEELWRRHTIPAPGEPGHDTWADDHDAWKTGGGSTWVTGSYDPEQDLIIWGVGNPGPDWDAEYRPGDNLYTNSAIALRPADGSIAWYFQYTPNDPYDYDGVAEHVLVDVTVNGEEPRKIALHADRNGFAYALDRTNGKFVWGTPFVEKLTWSKGLDPETGLPLEYDPEKEVQTYIPGTAPNRENRIGISCPGNMGGKNWPPTAYNPDHKLWYIPVIESCNTMENKEVIPGETYKPREFFTGGGPRQHEPISGSVAAVDAATGEIKAKYETRYPMLGGILTTAGDLVFTGHPSGEFVALDAATLEEVWRFDTNAGINAPPITYSVDGKQYVALLVGLGGAWPKWFVDGTEGLEKIEPGSMLYVFAL